MECLAGRWLVVLAAVARLLVELDVRSPLLMRFKASEVKMTVDVDERKSRLLRSQAVKEKAN